MNDALSDLTLEAVFRGRAFAAMPASPLQIAICRAADGVPMDLGELAPHFGVTRITGERPTFVELVCGRRGGKSFLASCAAIVGALTADCTHLKPFEVPRFAIVAPSKDLAGQTFSILEGIIRGSSILASLLSKSVRAAPAEASGASEMTPRLVLRRPDGRKVELCVVPASKGGRAVRGRWLAGFVLEECAHFGLASTGAVINAEDILDAASKALLPRAQGWLVSSPYGPQGLLYEAWREHFGKPGRWLVARAGTRDLNPSYPQEAIDAARKENPDHCAREHDAEWTDAEAALIPSEWVTACQRSDPADVPRLKGARYIAAMDPATRGNGWTLAIATRIEGRVIIACVREWRGSRTAPLDPGAVLREMAPILDDYGLTAAETDQWAGDALVALARAEGLQLTVWPATGPENWHMADQLRIALGARSVELPADTQVRSDLLGARRVLTPSGVSLRLPTTADGRHCDYVPSVTRAHHRAALMPAWVPPETRDEHEARLMREDEEAEERRYGGGSGEKWWRR